jgi:hypothetical protein
MSDPVRVSTSYAKSPRHTPRIICTINPRTGGGKFEVDVCAHRQNTPPILSTRRKPSRVSIGMSGSGMRNMGRDRSAGNRTRECDQCFADDRFGLTSIGNSHFMLMSSNRTLTGSSQRQEDASRYGNNRNLSTFRFAFEVKNSPGLGSF